MSKTLLIALALSLFSTSSFASPPVNIALFKGINPNYNFPEVKVKVTATTDKTEVKDVVVNRGNCRVDKKYAITNRDMLPKTLKYGESITLFVLSSCSVLQIDVITDQGNWTMHYQ